MSVPTVKQVLSSLCGQLRSELRSAEGGAGSGGKSNKIALQALQSHLPKVQSDLKNGRTGVKICMEVATQREKG